MNVKAGDRWVWAAALAAAGAVWMPMPVLSLPAAAVLVLFLPGWAALKLWPAVRESSAMGRFFVALAASLVMLPVPLSWLWSVTNNRVAVWGVVVGLDLLLLVLGCVRSARQGVRAPESADSSGASADSREPGGLGDDGLASNLRAHPTTELFAHPRTRVILIAMMLWLGAIVLGAHYLPSAAGRLEVTPAHDYVKHHAMLLSLDRYPLPLRNSFYTGEPDTPYYYYEYAYYPPASLRILTGRAISIPFAFGMTSATLAIATLGVVFLIARKITGSEAGGLLAAACVGAVGGWDSLAVLARVIGGGGLVVTLDAWCPVAWRVHNLLTQYIWCPQHMTAVLGLLLAVRWLQRDDRSVGWLVITPVLGAGIFGSSVYVSITIFLAATVYTVLRLGAALREGKRWRREVVAFAVIALAGAALMAKQAVHVQEMSSRYPGGLTAEWDRFPFALLGRLLPPGPLANCLDAPWIIAVDMGLGAAALVAVSGLWWRRQWRADGSRLLLLAGGLGALAMFTVRSDINPIDYAFRVAIMPLLVFGALAAGSLVRPEFRRSWLKPRRARALLIVGVLLGLPVGLYEGPVTAIRSVLQPQTAPADKPLLRWIRDHTPMDAVVQGATQGRLRLVEQTGRRTAVIEVDNAHVVVFRPIDEQRLRGAAADVDRAFRTSDAAEAHALLTRWRVDYLLVGTVEHERYGTAPQFDGAPEFEKVFATEAGAVYRVVGASGDGDVATSARRP